MFDRPGQEDEQFSETFVLLHGVSLHLVELDSEHLHILLDVSGIERGVVGHFDCEFLEFLEEGVVDGLLVLRLLCLHSLLKCY